MVSFVIGYFVSANPRSGPVGVGGAVAGRFEQGSQMFVGALSGEGGSQTNLQVGARPVLIRRPPISYSVLTASAPFITNAIMNHDPPHPITFSACAAVPPPLPFLPLPTPTPFLLLVGITLSRRASGQLREAGQASGLLI